MENDYIYKNPKIEYKGEQKKNPNYMKNLQKCTQIQ